jgi:hypothetical protein
VGAGAVPVSFAEDLEDLDTPIEGLMLRTDARLKHSHFLIVEWVWNAESRLMPRTVAFICDDKLAKRNQQLQALSEDGQVIDTATVRPGNPDTVAVRDGDSDLILDSWTFILVGEP